MKTKLFTILAIIFSTAFFSSCSEEQIDPVNTDNTGGTSGQADIDSF